MLKYSKSELLSAGQFYEAADKLGAKDSIVFSADGQYIASGVYLNEYGGLVFKVVPYESSYLQYYPTAKDLYEMSELLMASTLFVFSSTYNFVLKDVFLGSDRQLYMRMVHRDNVEWEK